MDKNWKVILAFAGVFLAGAVTGVSVSTLWMQKGPAHPAGQTGLRPNVDQYIRSQFATMARKLDLTPDQHEQLRPALQRASEELRTIRRQERQETVRILEKLHTDVVQVLTPEQRERFEKLRSQQRERIRHFLHEGLRPFGQPGDRPAHAGEPTPPPPPPTQEAPATPPTH